MRGAILCSLNLHSGGGFSSADFVVFFYEPPQKGNIRNIFLRTVSHGNSTGFIRKAIWVNHLGGAVI